MISEAATKSAVLVPTALADALSDPLQNHIRDLQVVPVLHDHVAAATKTALLRWREHRRLTAGRLERPINAWQVSYEICQNRNTLIREFIHGGDGELFVRIRLACL